MKGKIFITGTGRAGTSFLVQLFSNLNMDTGYSPARANELMNNPVNAGLEKAVMTKNGVKIAKGIRIIKSPHIAGDIENIIDNYDIDHFIIPIRKVGASARSRERISKKGYKPGGMYGGCVTVSDQMQLDSKMLHRLIFNITKHDMSHTFLPFPLILLDNNIIFTKLSWLFQEYNISKKRYLMVFNKLVDTSKIHIT